MGFTQVLSDSLNCDPTVLRSVLCEGVKDGVFRVSEVGSRVVFLLKDSRTTIHDEFSERCDASLARSPHRMPSKCVMSSIDAVLNALPDPTPVYSQWWFTRDTVFQLMRFLKRVCAPHSEIAILGAPSLGAVYSQHSRTPLTVFDIDVEVLQSLRTHFSSNASPVLYDTANTLERSFTGRFGVVFADPPWGRSLLRLFMRRTYELARVGGVVVVTLPQVFTRPGVREELQSLVVNASKWGMILDRVIPSGTQYQVSPFEHEAYKSVGIELDTPWRRGDILIFRKLAEGASVESLPCVASDAWDQFIAGKRRVFLLRSANGAAYPPSVHSVAGTSDFVCPTTSSRNEAFRHASLVTTQNGIATVKGSDELRRVLPYWLKAIESQPARNMLLELNTLVKALYPRHSEDRFHEWQGIDR